MNSTQKICKWVILFFSMFAGVVFSIFIIENLDTLFIPVFHKSFSGRALLIQVLIAIPVSVICIGSVFVLLRFILQSILQRFPVFIRFLQKESPQRNRLQIVLIFVFLLASASVFIIIAFFFRIICDDFDFLTKLRELGMWGAVKNHYLTWSGRYMQYPMQFFLEKVPEKVLFPVYSILIYTSICFGFAKAFMSLPLPTGKDRTQQRVFAVSLGIIITNGFFLILPNIFTSHYWYIGGITFTFGIAAQILSLSFMLQFLIEKKKTILFLILAFLFGLIANGTNELTAISMTILSICIRWFNPFAENWTKRQKQAASVYSLFNIFLLAFMISAPGNFARMSYAHHLGEEGIVSMVAKTFLNFFTIYWFFLQNLFKNIAILCTFCAVFFIMGTLISVTQDSKRFLRWNTIIFFLASFGCTATNAYLYNYLPQRSMAAPAMLLIISLCSFFLLLGENHSCTHESTKLILSRILICVIFCFLCSLHFLTQNFDSVREFSQECDYRDEELSTADKTARVTQTCRINFFFGELEEITADPHFIINEQVAAYYNLNGIVSIGDCKDFIPATVQQEP